VTTAPAVSVAPAAGTVVVGVPHEGVPPPVGDAEVAGEGDDAPAAPLATVPVVAPLVDPPGHGCVTGGVAGGGVGGADVGGGLVVIVVPAGGEAPAVGRLVPVDAGVGVVGGVVVGVGGAAGGGVVVVVVVAGAAASDVVTNPAEACPTPDAGAAVPAVVPAPAGAIVPVAAPTPAVADAARHRLASSTERAPTVAASRCCPKRTIVPSVPQRMR
jgi:hypothetical protein